MSNGQDEFVTIRPRRVALSHQTGAPARGARILNRHAAGGRRRRSLLIAVALWVFHVSAARVELRRCRRAACQLQPAAPHRPMPPLTPPAAVGTAPYEALQIDRERKRAQETLANFVKLQIKLDEEMHVSDWAPNAFDAAQQLANDGDALFTQQKFDEAMAHYEQGIAALETLSDSRRRAFQRRNRSGHRRRSIGAMRRPPKPLMSVAATVYPETPASPTAVARTKARRTSSNSSTTRTARSNATTGVRRLRSTGRYRRSDPKTQGLQGRR